MWPTVVNALHTRPKALHTDTHVTLLCAATILLISRNTIVPPPCAAPPRPNCVNPSLHQSKNQVVTPKDFHSLLLNIYEIAVYFS